MFRTGKLTCLAVGAAALAAAFTVLTSGAATAAIAATANGGPGDLATMASLAAPPDSITSTYSCDLSAFGSGISPVTLSATLAFPTTVLSGQSLGMTLTTNSVALPSTVLSKLTGTVSFGLSATVTGMQQSSGAVVSVPLSGTASVSGQLTGLPAVTAPGMQFLTAFTAPGTAVINVPVPSLTFTTNSPGTAAQNITCVTTAATQDVSVTIAAVGSSGPLYRCMLSFPNQPPSSHNVVAHVPVTITVSGGRAVGTTDTVTLAVSFPVLLPFDLDTSYGFLARLAVTGAQPGNITLVSTNVQLNDNMLRGTGTGTLRLTKTGTDHIMVPNELQLYLTGPPDHPLEQANCAIDASPVPVALTLTVTKGHVQPPSGSSPTPSSGTGVGQPQGSGTPSGAPETGGGTGSGADMAAVAAGIAIAAAGAGLAAVGRRRTRTRARARAGAHREDAEN